MRLGRSEEYRHHVCETAKEPERQRMRCPPYEPAKVPAYRVEMGASRRAELFASCPWSQALTPQVERWLSTYALISRFNRWPPGRDDPQLYEAIVIIQREHDAIDRELATT